MTKLDASLIVHLGNYVLLRRDRNKDGDGVAFFIHNSIFAIILCSSQNTTFIHDYGTKIIVGDFNADQLCFSADATFVRRFIDDNGLHNIPYGVTYHRNISDTWLDLSLVEKQDNVIDF